MSALLGSLLSSILPTQRIVPSLVSGGTKFIGSLLEGKGLPQALSSGLSSGLSTLMAESTLKEKVPDVNYKFEVETPDIATKYRPPIINTNSSNITNRPMVVPHTNARHIMNYMPQARRTTEVPVSAETIDTVSRMQEEPSSNNIMGERRVRRIRQRRIPPPQILNTSYSYE